jgi:hypothetical protein
MVTLIMGGVRLLLMQTAQRRRERENRQINERLRTLIAAYRVLGGSFAGELAVDPGAPAHRRTGVIQPCRKARQKRPSPTRRAPSGGAAFVMR